MCKMYMQTHVLHCNVTYLKYTSIAVEVCMRYLILEFFNLIETEVEIRSRIMFSSTIHHIFTKSQNQIWHTVRHK